MAAPRVSCERESTAARVTEPAAPAGAASGGPVSYSDSCGPADTPAPLARLRWRPCLCRECAMKVLLWIVAIIFFIGLAVLLGLGSLIF